MVCLSLSGGPLFWGFCVPLSPLPLTSSWDRQHGVSRFNCLTRLLISMALLQLARGSLPLECLQGQTKQPKAACYWLHTYTDVPRPRCCSAQPTLSAGW